MKNIQFLFLVLVVATACTTNKEVSYFENGKVRDLFVEKSNGKTIYKRYYDSGQIAEEFKGNKSITYRHYYENGQIKEVWIRNKDKNITFQSFDRDGALQQVVQGVRMFTNITFSPTGDEASTEIYTNPEPDPLIRTQPDDPELY